MVDKAEVLVTGVLIGLAEIINGKDSGMMIAAMSPLRDAQTMNRGRTLITTPDRHFITCIRLRYQLVFGYDINIWSRYTPETTDFGGSPTIIVAGILQISEKHKNPSTLTGIHMDTNQYLGRYPLINLCFKS
ncbi:hypothetical protein L484_020001 [Morus notabilis]|uniref:Uncharacterized protein n=1 Tax=Morus notabilis TaxID=981085 RepID=W9SZT0_9ROSA|nr:hypothetical protein L484_020001 [Morus notabilis]